MPLPEENPVYVRCVGEQFFWTFHYPGKDGVFGTINSEHFSGTNAVGLDPNDPAGKDDIVVRNTMTIPVKRPVVVQVTSKDVIHNYALHPMRIAQDAIPGLEIPTWYTPIEEGSFEIVCGQLCGAGHYAMRGFVEVIPQDDFETWLEEQHANTEAGRAEQAAQEQTAAASRNTQKQQS
jgi:cytochrome c oxidase subunit 2